jgi:hypothetical protein
VQYFILLPGDDSTDAMNSSNILGEESLGKFIYDDGFKALNYIVDKHPEVIQDLTIIDEHRKKYEVMEFLDLVATWKVYR